MNTMLETLPICCSSYKDSTVWVRVFIILRTKIKEYLPDEYKKIQSVKTSKLRSDHGCLKTAPVACVKHIFHI